MIARAQKPSRAPARSASSRTSVSDAPSARGGLLELTHCEMIQAARVAGNLSPRRSVGAKLEISRAPAGRVRLGLIVATVAAIALVVLVGCGSGKPSYCSERTKLENSIKGVTSLKLSGIISGLQSQVKTIQSDATSLVNSAKSDFPSQTNAVKTSVNALSSAVMALPSNPSATQIATVATSAAGVASSVKSFVDASSSKCG